MINKSNEVINKRLKSIAEQEGLSKSDALIMLMDLYELKDVNKFIELISYQYRQGMNISQINQLRILVSYLKSVIDKIENF